MRCEQAEQLFDAYLDGELSPSMATELGAHRLKCARCRRALALLEVSGHIIGSDREPEELSEVFSDRLLACVDEQSNRTMGRLRRTFYIGGPVAAAAVIVLAFAGFFDGRGESKVAGVKEIKTSTTAVTPEGNDSQATDESLTRLIERTQRNIDATSQGGASLQEVLDSTLRQTLDLLEQSGQDVPSPDVAQPVDTNPSDDGSEHLEDSHIDEETGDGR